MHNAEQLRVGAMRWSMQTRRCDEISSQSVFTVQIIVAVLRVQNDKTIKKKTLVCLRAAMPALTTVEYYGAVISPGNSHVVK